ncbi:Homoserine dehydrogenase [Hartmannibacter diazotrophicus]|uniref:Homoserine dehydrogenase n=1 Tax=Hartmannibacter diazotrophicus TaxID=1482074 RepID=A0A2C9D7T5_9HYPH|nr:homoserine dehydrogenase [Hartmannibacter diazotrophicus]SON56313.1 Homoserine dehydrogenase [Hartmannibacter diazotrophicus]
MSKPLRLGLAGLGTVGSSLFRLIDEEADLIASRAGCPIVVSGVSARNRLRNRGIDLGDVAWFDDPVALANDPSVDVFVELMGGEGGAAEASVRAALSAGKPVVTANKALLAKHGNELAELAEDNDAVLAFEAAVAGGIPIIKTLRESLAGNTISRVYGILNGTCNYILTRMERENLPFETCLAEAQRLGYAEADPTFDVEGFDTAHKLAILTSLAFGTKIDASSIYVEGIREITTADIEAADELGYRIKLLGVARRTETGIEQRVHPTMVPKSSAVARTDDVLNAVAVDGSLVGEIVLVGPGAGGNATASAVAGDIVDVARGLKLATFGRPAKMLAPYVQSDMHAHEGGYYVRLTVVDRPGAFASIAARMAEKGISLESIVQRRRKPSAEAPATPTPDDPQPVILMTYATTEDQIRAALDEIEKDGHIAAAPRLIRIEEL